jgi:ABC-type antimicrobial peptide transport system permease subunit
MLRLGWLTTLEEGAGTRSFDVILPIVVLSVSILAIAVAGLYALVSFTVSQRRREIGIRTALGASPHRVLAAILSRTAGQLGAGLVLGVLLSDVADRLSGGEMLVGREGVLLPGVAALMVLIGVLASWNPAKQALAIQPTEALRSE